MPAEIAMEAYWTIWIAEEPKPWIVVSSRRSRNCRVDCRRRSVSLLTPRVDQEPVNVGQGESRVRGGPGNGFHSELGGGAAVDLAELGHAEPGDSVGVMFTPAPLHDAAA